MAVVQRNTLKQWFMRGLKPLGSQFSDWIDSFRHVDDPISSDDVGGLSELLNERAYFFI